MNILVVEDDQFLANRIVGEFQRKAPINLIKHISSYDEFLLESSFSIYDIILIDICLGDNAAKGDGFTILTHIRSKNKKIPIIIMSNIVQFSYLEEAFSLGAQDYLVKPFRVRELQIRIQRWYHAYVFSEFFSHEKSLSYDMLTYIPSSNEYFVGEKKISLSKSSKYLLSLFLINKERLLSQQFLSEKIWGYSESLKSKNLRIKILRLKESLTPYKIDSRIQTVHGEGYILEKK